MTRFIILLLIIVAVAVGGYFAYSKTPAPERVFVPEDTQQSSLLPSNGKLMSVESYVTQNISSFSQEKEVLGGTFIVTGVSVDPEKKTGTVKYEDGHNAFVADFSYVSDDRTGYAITSFVVKP